MNSSVIKLRSREEMLAAVLPVKRGMYSYENEFTADNHLKAEHDALLHK